MRPEHTIWDGHPHIHTVLSAVGHIPENATAGTVDTRDIIEPSDDELRAGMGDELWEQFETIRAAINQRPN